MSRQKNMFGSKKKKMDTKKVALVAVISVLVLGFWNKGN